MIINSNTIPKTQKKSVIVNRFEQSAQTVVPASAVIDSKTDGDKHFAYEWRIPETSVHIQHGLDKRPSVTVIDSAGNELMGDIEYIDENNLTITFSAPVRGIIYLN